MPVERRSRRLFVAALAVPVIIAVYATTFGRRFLSGLRPPVATFLGATVIGSVYVEEAWRRTPAPVRVAPARSAAVMALVAIFTSAALPAAPTRAASPAEAVIAAAQGYIGTPYKLGTEGPKLFDCSGLMYRIFSDAGELPRIGGRRLRAVGYYNWFKSRGLATTSDPERGDLVVYTGTWHIGIYLGDGKVLSALATGVKVHGVFSITSKFLAFLKVDWSVGDPDDSVGQTTDKPAKKKKKPPQDQVPPADPSNEPSDQQEGNDTPDLPRGYAFGTLNLRQEADPNAKIIGWVSRGTTFTILGEGESPSGALWLNVKTRSGKTGWIWSRWTRPLDN